MIKLKEKLNENKDKWLVMWPTMIGFLQKIKILLDFKLIHIH
jgi:hypothetical protein